MPAEGLWPLAKGSQYAKSKQNRGAEYAGRRSVATGERLKVHKKQRKDGGPGMPTEGLWPLANGSK